MRIINWIGTTAATALFLALNVMPAGAVELRFDNPTVDGGTLAYDGIGGAMVGTNIIFQNVIPTATPLNSGVTLTCNPNCLLNFTTGTNTVENSGGAWVWNGGGTITLTGTLFNGAVQVATGTLLTGSFTGTLISPGGSLVGAQFTFSGQGLDTKNPDLLAFYGLTGFNLNFSNTDIGAGCVVGVNNSLSCTVTESDLVNTATPRVPEPASMLLFGLGLVGLGFWGRKRLN